MKLLLASIYPPQSGSLFEGTLQSDTRLIESINVTYRNGKIKASQCLKGPCTLEDFRAYKMHRLSTAYIGGSHPPLVITRRKRSKQL